MNRYPFWKYALIGLALVLGGLYALPNLFGESPAVQVSPAKPTSHLDAALQARLESALQAEGLTPVASSLEPNTLKLRFQGTEEQLKAKDLVQRLLNPNPAEPVFVVALNLVPASPAWLTRLTAAPRYLGLVACTSCCRWTCPRP